MVGSATQVEGRGRGTHSLPWHWSGSLIEKDITKNYAVEQFLKSLAVDSFSHMKIPVNGKVVLDDIHYRLKKVEASA